jgi:ligand-binding SRPBCC domain-containing protein
MADFRELRFEHWVSAPRERVFRFFAAPANLPRLTPPELRLDIASMELVAPKDGPAETGFAGAGSKIVVSFRPPFSPLRFAHEAEITSYQWCDHFQDEHSSWYQVWKHRHEFESAECDGLEATLVRDIVWVHVLLQPLAYPMVVRPMLRKMFAWRQRELERLIAAGEI